MGVMCIYIKGIKSVETFTNNTPITTRSLLADHERLLVERIGICYNTHSGPYHTLSAMWLQV